MALKFGQLEMLFSLTKFEVTTKHPYFLENHFRNQFEVDSNAALDLTSMDFLGSYLYCAVKSSLLQYFGYSPLSKHLSVYADIKLDYIN